MTDELRPVSVIEKTSIKEVFFYGLYAWKPDCHSPLLKDPLNNGSFSLFNNPINFLEKNHDRYPNRQTS